MTRTERSELPGAGLRRIRRDNDDRILGGVCAGIAENLRVDPTLVRILAVVLSLVSGGAGVFAYLVAWMLIPKATDEPESRTGQPVRTGDQH